MWKRTVQGTRRKIVMKQKQFVTEGNEKADELAQEGADVDRGQLAAVKA